MEKVITTYVGIDVSKKTLDVTLLNEKAAKDANGLPMTLPAFRVY